MGLFHALGKQLRKPHGIFAAAAATLMGRTNGPLNDLTISLLGIEPTDRVLELGFGPGHSIRQVAERANRGFVAGIDLSRSMVAMAQEWNAAAIAADSVESSPLAPRWALAVHRPHNMGALF
jgi:trans-aconitate methyltransferase